jgi:SAM-dependent methyltransferase
MVYEVLRHNVRIVATIPRIVAFDLCPRYHPHVTRDVDGAGFWDGCYAQGGDGWELGAPAPPLVRLLRDAAPPAGRAAVPGCGRAHDVALLTAHGFDATGFDFSDHAVAAATKLGRRVLKRNVFALGAEFPGAFDIVWEYTCFCAIDPDRRVEYVGVLAEILRPGGELIALFYPLEAKEAGKPPFPVTRAEIDRLLSKEFRIESVHVPVDSIERRRGHELLVRARRSG